MESVPTRREALGDNGILWVEGHRDNREVLVVFLGMAGYAVTPCDSIRQAARLVQDRHFDLYIVGDCLPYGSNLPLAAQIKAVNPCAPLIVYSALAFANDIERGLKAGAQSYVTKPGDLDILLATIKRLLRGPGPHPENAAGNPARQSCIFRRNQGQFDSRPAAIHVSDLEEGESLDGAGPALSVHLGHISFKDVAQHR
jgi:DNA-binding response OmpR family regulator